MGSLLNGSAVRLSASSDPSRQSEEFHQAVEFVDREGAGEPAGSTESKARAAPGICDEETL